METSPYINKHIHEGWLVSDFIDALTPAFTAIQNGYTNHRKFTSKEQVKEWCMSNQPYYKRHIPAVTKYFCELAGIK